MAYLFFYFRIDYWRIYLLPRRIRICKNEISWQKCIVSGIAGNHYDSVCGCHDSTVCHVYQTGLDQYSASTYYSGMLWKCQYYLFPSTEPDRNSGWSDGSSKIGWMWIFPYVSSDFYAIDEGGSGNAADVVVYGNLEWLSCTYYFLEKRKELDIAGGYPFLQFLLCNSEWLCFDHGSIRNCNDSDNGIVLYFPENDHWVHCNQRYQISNKL